MRRNSTCALLVSLWLCLSGAARAATFGDVVTLSAEPSDAVLDEFRHRLYLVNSNAGQIEVYDYRAKQLTGSIRVGTYPLGAAISMDGAYLYVTNTQSSTLSVVDLASNSVIQTVALPARPEGVEVGADGRVLITTQGTGTGNTLNTLLVFDRTQDLSQQVTAVVFPPPISTPSPLPALFVGRPATPFPGRLIRTPDGRFIIGMVAINQTTNTAQTTLFVYETASGVVLQNRTVTGQSTVLSISPDGARFMAGSTLYDTATLNVVAQMSTANLPFLISAAATNPNFNVQANRGGSAFSPDGKAVFGSFNTANTNARPLANVLYIANATNLGVNLGIKLPQTVLGRMVTSSDGVNLFAISEAGFLHLDLSTLYDYPILQPETTQVFLAVDNCNKGLAKTQVKVLNLGKGDLTFSVPISSTALVMRASSGVVPANIEFTMEPGRSGVSRQAGTNLFTGAAGGTGAPMDVTLNSQQAINYPNSIRVYMNYRDADQGGIIYPRPVSLNTAQGLQELLLDEARGRLYITNAGYNRLEIFDTRKQRFLPPIDVGQLPRSMAMSLDGGLLYIGNTGGESITILDLETLQIMGQVDFPPIPRAGNQNSVQPTAMAMGLSGLQFVMSNGGFWRLIGNQATLRNNGSATPATIGGPQHMMASPGGEFVLTLAGNGTAYLYNALIDTYTASRQLFDQLPVSYFAPMSAAENANFFTVAGLTVSPALSIVGGAERPGQTQVTAPTGPGQGPTQTTVSAGLRNVAAAYALDGNRFIRLTTPVRQNLTTATRDDARPTLEIVDIRTGAQSLVAVAPENPVFSVFGTTRVNIPSKQMVADSTGTAYAITLSGLSVIPINLSGIAPAPQISGGARGIANANDGSANYRPGSFITISGTNLAAASTADRIPLPTVLGGTCVTFNDVPIPLIETSAGKISAQIPAEVRSGTNVVQVRSLANARSSDPLIVTVQKPQ